MSSPLTPRPSSAVPMPATEILSVEDVALFFRLGEIWSRCRTGANATSVMIGRLWIPLHATTSCRKQSRFTCKRNARWKSTTLKCSSYHRRRSNWKKISTGMCVSSVAETMRHLSSLRIVFVLTCLVASFSQSCQVSRLNRLQAAIGLLRQPAAKEGSLDCGWVLVKLFSLSYHNWDLY